MGNTAARQVAATQHRLAQPHFRVALQQRYGTVPRSNGPRGRSSNPSINRALCLPSRSFTE